MLQVRKNWMGWVWVMIALVGQWDLYKLWQIAKTLEDYYRPSSIVVCRSDECYAQAGKTSKTPHV